MLKVVENATKSGALGGEGLVTIESDNTNPTEAMEELQGMEARHMAIAKAASMGYGRAGADQPSMPYPVDSTGQLVPMNTGLQPGQYKYRVDIRVHKSL